jgi:pimeloyl-ACP methyl ester carboxylesterase
MLQKIFSTLLLILLTACTPQGNNSPGVSNEVLKNTPPQYATIRNGKLEYYRIGHGSPIILISGYLSDISSWNRQFILQLANQHEVIIFNNRNVGNSVVISNRNDSAALAQDTYELIEALHLKKPAVLGISMGGMIAQELAVTHPQAIGQLILMNTVIAGSKAVRPDPIIEETLWNMPDNDLGRYSVAVKMFFPADDRLAMGVALATDRFKPENYMACKYSAVKPQQRQLVLDWLNDNDSAKKIARIQLPVLILNGEADAAIPPVNSLILAQTIPNAKLDRWRHGGHAMIYQYPRSLAQHINSFIAENTISG